MRRHRLVPDALALAVLGGALLPAAIAAQQVKGRVVDADDGTPVAGATVTLSAPDGTVIRRVVAGDDGLFWIWHTEAGQFRLSALRIGYATVEDQPVRLDSAGVVEVLIRMQPEAVPVDPVRVLARREIKRWTPDEFYDRMSRLEGRGTFMTREDIDATGARLPSLALQWAPGTWVTPGGGRWGLEHNIRLVSYGKVCSPSIYLNGRELPDWATLDDFVMVDRIEGIEIYRGNYRPDTYSNFDGWGCGMILVWTKTEYDPRFAFNWERTIMFGVIGGLLFGITSLF